MILKLKFDKWPEEIWERTILWKKNNSKELGNNPESVMG